MINLMLQQPCREVQCKCSTLHCSFINFYKPHFFSSHDLNNDQQDVTCIPLLQMNQEIIFCDARNLSGLIQFMHKIRFAAKVAFQYSYFVCHPALSSCSRIFYVLMVLWFMHTSAKQWRFSILMFI